LHLFLANYGKVRQKVSSCGSVAGLIWGNIGGEKKTGPLRIEKRVSPLGAERQQATLRKPGLNLARIKLAVSNSLGTSKKVTFVHYIEADSKQITHTKKVY
jgi:hypothetical protein